MVIIESFILVVVPPIALIRAPGGPAGAQVFLIGCALAAAAVLALSARALARGRRAGRAPIATWQLLQLAVGITMIGTDERWWAIAAAVMALAILALLVSPPVVALTTGSNGPSNGSRGGAAGDGPAGS